MDCPSKIERQVPPPSLQLLLMLLLLQLYCYCCTMVLLLCFSHHLGLLRVPTAQIHHSFTCGTSCIPQNIRTYVKRRCWKINAGCFFNTQHIHTWYISFLRDTGRTFPLISCLPGVDYNTFDYFVFGFYFDGFITSYHIYFNERLFP